jgi:hypothetical protein
MWHPIQREDHSSLKVVLHLTYLVLYLGERRSMYMQNLQNMSHFARYTFYGRACRTENCRRKSRKTYLSCRRVLHFLLCSIYSTISRAYEKNTHTLLTTNMQGQRAIWPLHRSPTNVQVVSCKLDQLNLKKKCQAVVILNFTKYDNGEDEKFDFSATSCWI